MSEDQVTAAITGYIERELTELLGRFRDRRAKLQSAIEAAAELDRVIPKIEKLYAATSKPEPDAPRRGRPPGPRPEFSQNGRFAGIPQKDRVLTILGEVEGALKPPEIAKRADIPSTSIYAVLTQLAGSLHRDDEGAYALKAAA